MEPTDRAASPEKESIHPYKRLQIELAALIASTPAGERLPAEPDLSRRLGVSRATLREAMRSFEGQGLIRRRQGVGTFVTGNSRVMDTGLEVLESIEALAQKIGLVVSMGDLHIRTIQASDVQAEALSVPPGTELVEVSRVILTENRPVAFLIDVLPEDILTPSELETGFTGSVLDFLLKRGTPPLDHSLSEVRGLPAAPEVARLLQIQRGDALIQFTARLYTVSGRVVDFSTSFFLPGYFRFHIIRRVSELSPQPLPDR